ncbi:hypothetical protein [Luteipulveratus halotolerans]|uniref:Uncharacterized protein n=1 Tax=Luteipulveratus halotolerans TaxID=1631356 RepID=A0A0L6CJ53_9MICO|nr:hypothetical protein [Luteipulveratus halotolerans]KNX37827.1 hypothetical protein VV01_12775 [Luteipulveratus halotolerans]
MDDCSQLRQTGVEPRRARDGTPSFHVVRHGVCIDADTWASLGADERYRAFVHATALMARSGPHVFSHESAAVLWGLPVVTPWPRKAHVVVDPRKARSTALIVRHEHEDTRAEEVDGQRATSAARTIIDLARDSGLLDAVAAADHALRIGLCTREDLEREARLLPVHTPGSGQARLAAELADPASESPGESLSRAQMFLLRFPRPRLQVEHRDADGLIGVVDFDWDGCVGEFDGYTKYSSRYAPTVDDARAIVYREKLREDRVRALPRNVARWGWDHALAGAPMAQRLCAQGVRPEPRRQWFTVPGLPGND